MVYDPTMPMPWLRPLQVPQHGARRYIDGVLGRVDLEKADHPLPCPCCWALSPAQAGRGEEEVGALIHDLVGWGCGCPGPAPAICAPPSSFRTAPGPGRPLFWGCLQAALHIPYSTGCFWGWPFSSSASLLCCRASVFCVLCSQFSDPTPGYAMLVLCSREHDGLGVGLGLPGRAPARRVVAVRGHASPCNEHDRVRWRVFIHTQCKDIAQYPVHHQTLRRLMLIT